MKPFRFSLQPIRVLREQREREAQKAFAAAMRLCEEAALQLQLASDELASGWNALCQELSDGVSATKLVRTRAWCNVLEFRQKECNAALLRARRMMDDAWKDMMACTRDRETLDRYHDKCRAAWQREAGREEQKNLDELGLRRATAPGSLFPNNDRPGKDRL
ncbi:MAG: flagellar export protein FliJ [Verrucomicrobiota bacterium]